MTLNVALAMVENDFPVSVQVNQPIIRSRRVRFRVANPIQEKALWRFQQSEKAS